jgi:hypothetical protein
MPAYSEFRIVPWQRSRKNLNRLFFYGIALEFANLNGHTPKHIIVRPRPDGLKD